MKITRDTVWINSWCCNTFRIYLSANCLYPHFNPDEPAMIINMRSTTDPVVDCSEMIGFCPFCGEKLEVEA